MSKIAVRILVALGIPVIALGAPANEPAEKETKGDVIPRVSELPRLTRLWQAPGLSARSLDEGARVVTADAVFAWDASKREIVALDLRSGKQRWRAKLPKEADDEVRLELGVVGPHVLVRFLHLASVAAYSARSGKMEWYSSLGCTLIVGLHGGATVAAGACFEKPGESLPGRPSPDAFDGNQSVVALDLGTGKELWRKPVEGRRPAVVASDGRAVVIARTDMSKQTPFTSVFLLGARTGKELWQTEVPDMVFAVALGDKTVFTVGTELRALSLKDGKAQWSYQSTERRAGLGPSFVANTSGFAPQYLGGLLVWPESRWILGLDPATGRERKRWPLPAGEDKRSLRPMATKVSGKRLTIILRGFPMISEWGLVLFEGEERKVVAMPSPMKCFVGVEGDILVVFNQDPSGHAPGEGSSTDGYSLAQLAASVVVPGDTSLRGECQPRAEAGANCAAETDCKPALPCGKGHCCKPGGKVGVAAAPALPERDAGARLPLPASKTTALGAINRMTAGAIDFYMRDHLGPGARAVPRQFPGQATANWTPDCCKSQELCPPADQWSREPWAGLGFSPKDAAKGFRFDFRSMGTGLQARFLAIVSIDADCSGKPLYMWGPGWISEQGDVDHVYPPSEGTSPPSFP